MSDCGCGSNDYYGDTGAYNSYCNADTPYPSVSNESVPSLIDNLVNALYGAITKDVSSGKVVWNIPCDPANIPATINGIPRNTGEGLLCYIIRALNLTTPSGFVTVNGVQTLTNKTLTAPAINGATLTGTLSGGTFASPTINNLTATGTLTLPSGSITSAMIANGAVLPADLSTGGPSWDTSGNLTSFGKIQSGTAQFSSGFTLSGGYKHLVEGTTYFDGTNYITPAVGSNTVAAITTDTDGVVFHTSPNTGNTTRTDTPSTFLGYEKVRISASGNVGIGTSSPNAPLHVDKAQNGATRVLVNNQNTGASAVSGINLQAYGGGWTIDVPQSATYQNPLQFVFSGAEKARINSDGSIKSLTTARAWVNFNGVATIFTGTYTQSGTTVVVSGNNFSAAGFQVGFTNIVFTPTSGAAVAGTGTVTAVTTTSMTLTVANSVTASGNYSLNTNLIRSSYNVSSITKNGTGYYTVNFATALTDANYAVSASSGVNSTILTRGLYISSQYTGAFNVTYYENNANADQANILLTVFGN